MSTPRSCCVKGCSSVDDNLQEKLLKFPPMIDARAKRWLELYPDSFIRGKGIEKFICVRHFTPDCFKLNGGLLQKAIPSVNIDTSYAQDIMMRSFLMKVMFEWVLRNEIEAFSNVIWDKVLEAKTFLGMQLYTQKSVWIAKFVKFKYAALKSKSRFGSGKKGPKKILEIIKDIRKELPSNFVLPADNILHLDSGEVSVKKENEEDNCHNSIVLQTEEYQRKDAVPNKSLDTYQEAFELLQPLKDYIERTGNVNASLRLTEIETVVKQAIKTAGIKRKASKRKR